MTAIKELSRKEAETGSEEPAKVTGLGAAPATITDWHNWLSVIFWSQGGGGEGGRWRSLEMKGGR